MNRRLIQILIVGGLVLAFLPVLAVNFLLEGYVRAHEGERVYSELESLADETQYGVYSAVSAIQTVLDDSPSLCTPTFVANMHKALQSDIYLKQMVVENRDGVQYCDGYDGVVMYAPMSPQLAIPGKLETISAVTLAGDSVPSLKVTHNIGNNRSFSAFVHVSPRLEAGLSNLLSNAALLRLRLTDGTDIFTSGDASLASNGARDSDYVHAKAVADALPISAEVVLPFAPIFAGYADLAVTLSVVAVMVSAVFLFLLFKYIRQVRLADFDLERAISRGELQPYYQPVMNISSGRLSGCEVLVRWQKKNGKLVPPGLFIDYAEASGLAIPMTIKLMEQVRNDLSSICAEQPNLKIGINLFEGHFRDTAIVDDVQTIFDGSPISFRQLVFEITERRPLQNQLATNSAIGGLHALGCRIAMDDAGTGHSNLEYLQTLGIDILKIDRVFIDMIEDGAESVPILDSLINMASNMGLDVIAEGVETEAQALYLREHGVFEAQGFLFAPALPIGSFAELARALNGKPGIEGSGAESEPGRDGRAAEGAAA